MRSTPIEIVVALSLQVFNVVNHPMSGSEPVTVSLWKMCLH